jgi:hypothetical protein
MDLIIGTERDTKSRRMKAMKMRTGANAAANMVVVRASREGGGYRASKHYGAIKSFI